jgi:hypothetical protein
MADPPRRLLRGAETELLHLEAIFRPRGGSAVHWHQSCCGDADWNGGSPRSWARCGSDGPVQCEIALCGPMVRGADPFFGASCILAPTLWWHLWFVAP